MFPMALHKIGLCVALCISSTLATPIPFLNSLEGSADEEEFENFTSSLPTSYPFSRYQTTPVASPTHVETDFLGQMVNFLEQNMLLILVTATFLLLLCLIICGAIFMSRRQKVNAYYPSSFPSKMYVDHRDKTGGAKLFNEVPEKPAPEQESQPVDSHKQLQADIMRAAKSLRTPNKSVDAVEGSEHSPEDSSRPEDSSGPDDSVLEQQLPLPSLPEEKEPCELPDSGSAAEQSSAPPEQLHQQEDDDSQQPHPGTDDAQEPLIGRSLRPSSLHIHNDSATLQLIAGEKTAF